MCKNSSNDYLASDSIFISDIVDETMKNCSAQNFFNNLCSPNITNLDKNLEFVSYIVNEINNGSFNSIFNDIIQQSKSLMNVENNITFVLTTISNQNYGNISKIIFDECEAELKLRNIISQNEKLILFKIEYSIEGIEIPIVEYSLFTKDGNNVSLSYCDDIPVYYSIPVLINEKKEFIHNPNSNFYQDRCLPFKSDDDADITIYDRKNDFNNKYLSLCEKNCEYNGYDISTKRANCECKIKIKFPFLTKINIDKKELLNNFKDFDKNSNLFVVLCYKLFFSKEGLEKNICSYLMLIFIGLVIICAIFFACKGYYLFAEKINDIIFKRFPELKEIEDKKEKIFDLVIYSKNSGIRNIKNNNNNLQ